MIYQDNGHSSHKARFFRPESLLKSGVNITHISAKKAIKTPGISNSRRRYQALIHNQLVQINRWYIGSHIRANRKDKNPTENTIKQPPMALVILAIGVNTTINEVVAFTSSLADLVSMSRGALVRAAFILSSRSLYRLNRSRSDSENWVYWVYIA